MEQLKMQHNFSNLYYNKNNKKKLILLLKKFIKPLNNDIIALFRNKLSDATIVKCLIYFSNKKNNKLNDKLNDKINDKSNKRANEYYEILNHSLLIKPIIIKKYLDIGCGNGYYTVSFGKKLGLTENEIYGIDTGNFAGVKITPITGFIYKEYNGEKIPYQDNMFDMVTMFMVLHHVEKNKIKELFNEIYRVLVPNGILLMREHNKTSYNSIYLFKLEHYLYNIYYDKVPFEQFYNIYYEYYYSKDDLIKLCTSHGFKYIKQDKEYYDKQKEKENQMNNPTNNYKIIFQKK